jgi:hypothetical protein
VVVRVLDVYSYGLDDQLAALSATGFVNQLERFVRPAGLPYSYVFGHEAGYLDHALASASLSPQVAGVAEWHANADEPEVIDYNTNGKPQDLYDAQPYRASDHDPLVVSLALQSTPAFSDVTASVQFTATGLGFNRVTQLYTGSITLVNRSATALAGPLSVKLGGLPAGVTLVNAAGTHEGAPYLRTAGGLAPGASVTLPLTLRNPNKVNPAYTPAIYSGTF